MYVNQALQSMAQAPQAQAAQGPSLGAMAASAEERKAWEAANPGKSHASHKLAGLLAGLGGPESAAMGLLGQLPSAGLGGLLGLGAKKVF
jgi:hypothetical protein